jgi:hypothetical protein
MSTNHPLRPILTFAVLFVVVWLVLVVLSAVADAARILPPFVACNSEADEASGPHTFLSFSQEFPMKHKKDYTALALDIAAKTAAVANHLADDGEEPLSDDEGRVFAARALKKATPSLIASALRVDEEDVRTALTEIAAADADADADDAEPVADAS